MKNTQVYWIIKQLTAAGLPLHKAVADFICVGGRLIWTTTQI